MNANKIQSVISSCLRRAPSSVAMGTAKSALDQRKNHTYLFALFPSPSLAPFSFKLYMLPWNVGYLTTNICYWANNKSSATRRSFTYNIDHQQQLMCWCYTLSIILGLAGTGRGSWLPWDNHSHRLRISTNGTSSIRSTTFSLAYFPYNTLLPSY